MKLPEKQEWIIFLSVFSIFGMVSGSKFLPSVTMFFMVGAIVFDLKIYPSFRFGFRPNFLQSFSILFKSPPFLALWLICLPVFVSGLWSENLGDWLNFSRIRLPLLALPLVFASLKPFTKRELYIILTLASWIFAISTLYVWYYYILDFSAINLSLFQGKCLPTPIYYIRYGLSLAFAVIILIQMIFEKHAIFSPIEVKINTCLAIYLFLFIHLLAVRSGLAALYGSGILWLIYYVYHTKSYSILVKGVLAMFFFAIVSYFLFPSLKQKISYSLYDWQMHKSGKGNNYSDSDRLRSLDIGMKIIKDNLWLGVGTGDIDDEKNKRFLENFPPGTIAKLPHNQFVLTTASTGIFGLVCLLLGLLIPLINRGNYKDPIFLCFNAIIFLSLLVEYTFETSIGAAFFILFECFCLNYLKGINIKSNS